MTRLLRFLRGLARRRDDDVEVAAVGFVVIRS
jgi:hypothetical protein